MRRLWYGWRWRSRVADAWGSRRCRCFSDGVTLQLPIDEAQSRERSPSVTVDTLRVAGKDMSMAERWSREAVIAAIVEGLVVGDEGVAAVTRAAMREAAVTLGYVLMVGAIARTATMVEVVAAVGVVGGV